MNTEQRNAYNKIEEVLVEISSDSDDTAKDVSKRDDDELVMVNITQK